MIKQFKCSMNISACEYVWEELKHLSYSKINPDKCRAENIFGILNKKSQPED